MTCKDCLHYEACLKMAIANNADEFNTMFANKCDEYANYSKWVHLPCNVGDVVYQVTRNFISEFRVRFVEIATCGNLFLHAEKQNCFYAEQ